MTNLVEIAKKSWNVWNGSDFEEYMSFFADDALYNGPGRSVKGKEAIRAQMLLFREAFPNEVLTVRTAAQTGNTVFTRFHATAVNSGTMRWSEKRVVQPTGKRFNLEGVTLFEFRDDKIVLMEDFFDLYNLLFKQLGWDFPQRRPSAA